MKDLGFTETQQAIRSTIREYLEREVEPLVAEMEAERLLPYVPIRRMVAALGFGGDGELTQMIKDSPPEEMLKFFVPRILSIEMSRICAGMALSHGASLGLCAGNVLSKGTPEQKERFASPLLRFEKIGAWALTEPQAGSSDHRSRPDTSLACSRCRLADRAPGRLIGRLVHELAVAGRTEDTAHAGPTTHSA